MDKDTLNYLSKTREQTKYKYFLTHTTKKDGVYPFYLADDDKNIVGTELVSEGWQLVFYIWPIQKYDAMLMMCVGTDEDQEIENFLNEMSEYEMKIYRRPWPYFITAIDNGIHGRWHLPSLIAAELHSKRSYFTSVLLSNIRSDELYESEYVLDKVSDLRDFTCQMIVEMKENKLTVLDKAKLLGATVFDQVGNVARIIRVINSFN